MPYPTIIERPGSLSATGMAKEASGAYGVPVAATTFLPMVDNTTEEDPGWFSPLLMQNLRDKQIYNLQGEAKYGGAITGPIFPSNAMALLVASIGADNTVGYGITGTIVTPTSNTLSGSTLAGATTVTLTSATGFVAGQQVTIDTGALQETRRIASVATNTLTLSDALAYAHTGGVAAVTGGSTTMTSPSIATATTVVVASISGITAGTTFIQIDTNSPSGTTTSEVRKVTSIATLTLTLDTALVYAHATSSVVTIVTTPYTHTIQQQNTLPSLTVEKNMGGFQSLQFAGCRVNKFDLKAPVGNTAVEMTADLMAQSAAILNSPTAVTVTNEMPFVFSEATLQFYGGARADVSNVSITLENGIKETYTYSGNHGPSFLTPVTFHVSGAVDVVWSSLNDATYGDYNRAHNQTLGAMTFTLAHPASAGTITFTMPQIAVAKFGATVKMEDVIMSALTFEASRPLSGVQQYTLQATVSNNVWLAY